MAYLKCILFVLLAAKVFAAHAAVGNFRLMDHEGNSHELYSLKDRDYAVLISYSQGCPILRHHYATVNALKNEFGAKATFYYIYATDGSDSDEVRKEAKQFALGLPVLLDFSRTISYGLEIERSATAVVIETKNWNVVYHGPVDDRVSYETQKMSGHTALLKNELSRLIRGGKPKTDSKLPVEGCKVFYDPEYGFPPRKVKYEEAALILASKCQRCHSENGSGPWILSGISDARKWSPMIEEVLRTKRMPPWQPSPFHQPLRDEAGISAREEALVLNWIQGGATPGEKDPLKEPRSPRKTPGPADFRVDLQEQEIPATGPIDYRYLFAVAPNESQLWARLRIRTTNPKALHHATLFLASPQESEADLKKRFDHYLATYAPGADYDMLDDRYARKLPAHARLMVVLHYQSTGKPEVDSPYLEIWKNKDKDTREMVNVAVANMDFKLEPLKAGQKITGKWTSPNPVDIHAVIPHMHGRGKRIELKATPPGGEPVSVLNVPAYNFKWQNIYVFKNLQHFPAGTQFDCTGYMDNSKNKKEVRFGLQSDDEMLMCHLETAGARLN